MSGDPPLKFRPLIWRNLDGRVCRDTVPQRLDYAQSILNRQGRQFGKGLGYVDHGCILPQIEPVIEQTNGADSGCWIILGGFL